MAANPDAGDTALCSLFRSTFAVGETTATASPRPASPPPTGGTTGMTQVVHALLLGEGDLSFARALARSGSTSGDQTPPRSPPRIIRVTATEHGCPAEVRDR